MLVSEEAALLQRPPPIGGPQRNSILELLLLKVITIGLCFCRDK